MRNLRARSFVLFGLGSALSLLVLGCGGSDRSTSPPPAQSYTINVNTIGTLGVTIGVSPADSNNATNGVSNFARTYPAGTTVTLSAPSAVGPYRFTFWTGCSSERTTTCTVVLNANTIVAANYLAPATYALKVQSVGLSAVTIKASPADFNGLTTGSTDFVLTYKPTTVVTLTAPATSGAYNFSSWTGCATATDESCTVTLDADTTVMANYTGPTVTGVAVTPGPTTTATIGSTAQFAATLTGTGAFDNSVTWSLQAPPGTKGSIGSISATGLYETPYPAPAAVTVIATSNANKSISGKSIVYLKAPAAGAAMALSVDLGTPTVPISPYIYGWDGFQVPLTEAQAIDLPINRWGGDATTRYNYKIDGYNSASDYWYQNNLGVGSFDDQVASNNASKTATIGTMPLIGWTMSNNTNCSFSVAKYGAQQQTSPYSAGACGNGVLLNGNPVVNDPTDTSQQIDETWTTGWMQYLVGKWGTAAKGGVAIYNLDNEPTWWDAVHKDVHGAQIQTAAAVPYKGPFTYDEVTNKGLSYAAAIKAVDPTAMTSGPVLDSWLVYFYSKKDVETGWGSGPDYVYNGNPVDRLAHGDVPFIEYYLQQFKKNQDTTGTRLLDYVDIHGYFAANGAAFNTAGDTTLQQARLNSTRVFWDPTYTDPNYTDPSVRTSAAPAFPPQLIRMLKTWVANDYPGTKTSIDEYNWGGQEHINGALAQADILGIFGREGLDLGALWGTPDPTTQIPGLMAFEVYRNYDGSHSKFGDTALTSVTPDQSKLAIYGAVRASDGAVTIVVINKTYSAIPGTISLPNLTATASAKAFLYSNANLAAIVAQPDITVSAPTATLPASLSQNFPGSSITVIVIPTK